MIPGDNRGEYITSHGGDMAGPIAVDRWSCAHCGAQGKSTTDRIAKKLSAVLCIKGNLPLTAKPCASDSTPHDLWPVFSLSRGFAVRIWFGVPDSGW